MKIIAKLGFALSLTGAFLYGADWSGKLIDASCHDKAQSGQEKAAPSPTSPSASSSASCEPTAATTSFAIQTSDGKVYKLDSAGNAKASSEMRAHPDGKASNVTVSGTLEGQMVKVDSISMK